MSSLQRTAACDPDHDRCWSNETGGHYRHKNCLSYPSLISALFPSWHVPCGTKGLSDKIFNLIILSFHKGQSNLYLVNIKFPWLCRVTCMFDSTVSTTPLSLLPRIFLLFNENFFKSRCQNDSFCFDSDTILFKTKPARGLNPHFVYTTYSPYQYQEAVCLKGHKIVARS